MAYLLSAQEIFTASEDVRSTINQRLLEKNTSSLKTWFKQLVVQQPITWYCSRANEDESFTHAVPPMQNEQNLQLSEMYPFASSYGYDDKTLLMPILQLYIERQRKKIIGLQITML